MLICLILHRILLSRIRVEWLVLCWSWVKHISLWWRSCVWRHFMLFFIHENWGLISKYRICIVLIAKVLNRLFLSLLILKLLRSFVLSNVHICLRFVLRCKHVLRNFLRTCWSTWNRIWELVLPKLLLSFNLVCSFSSLLLLSLMNLRFWFHQELLSNLEWLSWRIDFHQIFVSTHENSIGNHSAFFTFITMHLHIFHDLSRSSFLSQEFSNLTDYQLPFNWLVSHVSSFL